MLVKVLTQARPLRLSLLRCSDLLQLGINSSSVLTVACVPNGGCSKHLNVDVYVGEGADPS